MSVMARVMMLGSLTVFGAAAPLPAQGPERTIRVYLDCQTRGCDFDHFRREIAFAAWMRAREDAQVHVLVTGRGTGGGGREFTLTFFGRDRFAGRQDTLAFTTPQTATDAEIRDDLTRMLGLGLVPYATRNGAAAGLRVVSAQGTSTHPDPGRPPGGGWDYWVFRVRAGGFVRGESLQNSLSADGGASASRVTEALKFRIGANGRYVRDQFLPDSAGIAAGYTTETYVRTSWGSYVLAGWSIGRHWAAGGRFDMGASSYFNQDFFYQGGPTAEYNVFPYEESTRRVLAATLTVGGVGADYIEETIYGKTTELHPASSLEVQFSQRQQWGTVHGNVEWLQYWHDTDVHLLELFTGMEIRIVRGLNFDLFGSFARVQDQLYLSAAGLTPEEVLREQRARGTDYRFRVNFGLSYTFGATENSIVNPRLDL